MRNLNIFSSSYTISASEASRELFKYSSPIKTILDSEVAKPPMIGGYEVINRSFFHTCCRST